jgi:hypothetical protein
MRCNTTTEKDSTQENRVKETGDHWGQNRKNLGSGLEIRSDWKKEDPRSKNKSDRLCYRKLGWGLKRDRLPVGQQTDWFWSAS